MDLLKQQKMLTLLLEESELIWPDQEFLIYISDFGSEGIAMFDTNGGDNALIALLEYVRLKGTVPFKVISEEHERMFISNMVHVTALIGQAFPTKAFACLLFDKKGNPFGMMTNIDLKVLLVAFNDLIDKYFANEINKEG